MHIYIHRTALTDYQIKTNELYMQEAIHRNSTVPKKYKQFREIYTSLRHYYEYCTHNTECISYWYTLTISTTLLQHTNITPTVP